MFVFALFVISFMLAAVAGGFSIIGLIAIYPASAVGVLIGAVIIEVCKLATISFLYQFYDVLKWGKKLIAMFFITVAMSITSMGVYGYLTKGYIQQVAPMANVEAQINEIDANITRLQDEVDRSIAQIQMMNNMMVNDQSEERAQQQATARNEQRAAYESVISKNQVEIATLQSEKANLGVDIRQIRIAITQGDNEVVKLQRAINSATAQIKAGVPPEQKEQLDKLIADNRESINAIRDKKSELGIEIQKIEAKITPININIDRLKSEVERAVRQTNMLDNIAEKDIGTSDRQAKLNDDRAEQKVAYEKVIATNQALIAELRSKKTSMTIEIQKIEAEVGPIQYVADLIFSEGENTRDKALKWFSIILVIAIDPFAVALLVFANAAYMHRNDPRVKHEFGGLLANKEKRDTMEVLDGTSKEEILAKVFKMIEEKAEDETKIPEKSSTTTQKVSETVNDIQDMVESSQAVDTKTPQREVSEPEQKKQIDNKATGWLERGKE